ncbi:acyl carrier protein [Streptomyces sp. NPDC016562]|uniref:acyl carrier protein n=1 Tax=Streptomyces sp. NPDC016562 TaxID=3364966 RepID=UPI0036FAA578
MYDRLVRLLTEVLSIDPALVTPQRTFRELELDSITLVELAVMVTEETGISLQELNLDLTLAQTAERFAAQQSQSSV